MAERQYSERRRYERAQILCPLTLYHEGTSERLAATNLNEGGLLVLSRTPIKTGPKLHLIFELPNGRIIEADGEVCATMPEIGFGIKFTGIEPEQRDHISQLVQTASGEAREKDQLSTPEQTEG